jgi:pimeloyl-ACP methyl ester carboxylesterase
MDERFLDVGRLRIAYRREGRGPDVVFVHGWPLHSATWRHVVPRLAESFTCHLVDLPGTGRTDAPADHVIDFRSHAAAVRGAIDALGLSRVALLAHDSGGVVARLVAADDARVAALVLEGTEIPGHRPPVFATMLAALSLPGAASVLRASMRLGPIRRSRLGFGGCFTDPAYVEGDFRSLFVDPLVSDAKVADGHMRLVRSLDWADVDALVDVHARIRAKVQLVWGAEDPFFPLPVAEKMAPQFAGGAELRVIPRAKLFAHEDHPDAFAAHVAPFLRAALS